MDGESIDIKQSRLQRLKELFPELFAENQLDWEKLKAAFGDDINFANERYVLNWAGKSDAFKILQQPTTATLIQCPGEGINDHPFNSPPYQGGEHEVRGGSENLFIEGENLEVLKVLQKAYYNKVKCIIIDPPYNTGSDSFIYPDKFSEKKEDYLKRIGDKDEEGFLMKEGLFRKNSKDSGHYHSNWLSMMYPRLFLAKNLLRDDGVIFVHIDDNEVHNLRLVMNEIFGEENFVAQLIWNLRSGTQAGHFTRSHEYIVVYTKNKDSLKYFEDLSGGSITHGALKIISKANPASEITFPAGMEFEGKDAIFSGEIGGNERQILIDDLIFKDGKLSKPARITAGWAMKNQVLSWLAGKETIDSKGQKVKRFYFNSSGILWYEKERGTIHPKTVLPDAVGNTKKGSDEIIEIFGNKIFDFPKPSSLPKFLIETCSNKSDDIILDFFGGSGTTAHAVLELNKEDDGNRKFILVQMSEQCDQNSEAFKAGYKTIADIAKERIRRVIQRIEKEKAEKPDLFEVGKLDLGFKVFKLSPSSFKIWRSSEIDSAEKLVEQLDAFTDPIRPGAEKQNMLYELMLKAGRKLTSPIQHVMVRQAHHDTKSDNVTLSLSKGDIAKGATGVGYYSINNNNELIIALDAMNEKLIDQIIVAKPQKVITLDILFAGNDQLKTNTVLQMRDAGVDFKTI